MPIVDVVREKVEALAKPIVSEAGLDLIELKVTHRSKNYAIQLIIDRPMGGISLDECTTVNRRLAEVLDEDEELAELYSLEVASPGLDRPLTTVADFRRIGEREIRLFLTDEYEGKKELTGLLKEIKDDELILEKGEEEYIIPMHFVSKGMQVI